MLKYVDGKLKYLEPVYGQPWGQFTAGLCRRQAVEQLFWGATQADTPAKKPVGSIWVYVV